MLIIRVCSGKLSQFPTVSIQAGLHGPAGPHQTLNKNLLLIQGRANLLCFRNSVSHEFYQVMVGSPSMNLHGWRQLCEWSIQYSCLSNEEKQQAFKIFWREWETFCKWVVTEYGPHAETLDVQL
jgi:hypothetical protein